MGKRLMIAPTGELYAAGDFEGTADFDPGNGVFNLTSLGSSDLYIEKMDLDGKLIWVKQLGGTGAGYLRDIQCDANGNIYLAGYFIDTADFDPVDTAAYKLVAIDQDIFVEKLDPAHHFIWAAGMGGYYYNRGLNVVTDSLNNVYTTGYFKGSADFSPGKGTYYFNGLGESDVFVSKLGPGILGVASPHTLSAVAFPNPVKNRLLHSGLFCQKVVPLSSCCSLLTPIGGYETEKTISGF